MDESALLGCMAYVDLNPIRVGISRTPETSDFTSIQERIQSYQKQEPPQISLCRFEDDIENVQDINALPISQHAYFELVDMTGRLVKEGKRGAITKDLAPILNRLKINPNTWL